MNYKNQPKVRIKETGEVKKVEDIHYEATKEVCVEGEDYYDFDEIEFITDTTHLTASQAVYAGVGPDGEPLDKPEKVSDCCGAEVYMKNPKNITLSDSYIGFRCKSCGEPCEAVEEDGFPIPDDYKRIKEIQVDTKPDPIEPKGEISLSNNCPAHTYVEENRSYINEIIERLNLLQQHE